MIKGIYKSIILLSTIAAGAWLISTAKHDRDLNVTINKLNNVYEDASFRQQVITDYLNEWQDWHHMFDADTNKYIELINNYQSSIDKIRSDKNLSERQKDYKIADIEFKQIMPVKNELENLKNSYNHREDYRKKMLESGATIDSLMNEKILF